MFVSIRCVLFLQHPADDEGARGLREELEIRKCSTTWTLASAWWATSRNGQHSTKSITSAALSCCDSYSQCINTASLRETSRNRTICQNLFSSAPTSPLDGFLIRRKCFNITTVYSNGVPMCRSHYRRRQDCSDTHILHVRSVRGCVDADAWLDAATSRATPP